MNKFSQQYLTVYNYTAFLSWLFFLAFFFLEKGCLAVNGMSIMALNIAQGIAILEILHAAFKLVKAPVTTTSAQIFSRLLILGIINFILFQHIENRLFNVGVYIIIFAWTITELVRYSYHFISRNSIRPFWITWMRYSFFIILYPLGILGEWFIILSLYPTFGTALYFIAPVGFLLVTYIWFFPKLFGYLLHQRKSKLKQYEPKH